ncbi:hypothetical protein [Desmospora profundinema]|uniref:Glucan phosphoethanolaminetransferase (Alkaline phosphatase superfamily) n=1 Tax=Desmospora profundinema TaxID=1571184 RepID=A0ABU1IP11_9BACL|nr:hypothetical protein [Desmospora profundinema]MDR6226128.1 glucan phosphoethanolaminetransferase (alkaline phosphatase superfamily) [Desmospora profundinema]
MVASVRNSLVLSFVFSLLVLPFITVGLVFYHLFSGTGDQRLLFNTVTLTTQGNASFSFSLDPAYFLLMAAVFVATFLVVFIIHKAMKRP